MVLLVLFETSHWKGNESQDIVVLIETMLMLTKGGCDFKKKRAS
jgi:hypothetical protein